MSTYGSVIIELLPAIRLSPLGPGSPNRALRPKLDALSVETAFAPHPVRDPDRARACLAGLWLYHDFLDESHTLSQSLPTAAGGYWHGLMHRREPDFANAKYWFRHVGDHPVFEPLRVAAAELAAEVEADDPARFLATQSAWDPFAFIDLCEACLTGSAPHTLLCQQIQRREWELLFDDCYRAAVGR